MEILIAILVATIGYMIILWACRRDRGWRTIAFFGLSVRFGLAIAHRFAFTLPQGASDAKVFQRLAVDYSMMGCGSFWSHVKFDSSYVYSSLLSEFFSCIGHSPLAAQFLNGIFGTLALIYMARGTRQLWGTASATRVLWIVALLPPLIVFSAVTLRESLIFLFFSLGAWATLQHSSRLQSPHLMVASFWFAMAGILHPGMFAAIPGLLLARVLWGGPESGTVSKTVLVVRNGILLFVFLLPLFPLILSLSINKIGHISEFDSMVVSSIIERRASGGAAYLTGLSVGGPVDIVWQSPIRMIYFLFSPLPWDIRATTHLFALTDAMIYLFAVYLLWRFRKHIKNSRGIFSLLVIIFVLVLVYSFGTSNFGTGMRHRSKFVPWLLVAVAPLFFKSVRRRLKYQERDN